MILSESTGVAVMPPFRALADGRLSLSFAEAELRYKFFLTYFDRIAALPFNMQMPMGSILTSSELEQVLIKQGIIDALLFGRLEQNGAFDVDLIKGYSNRAFADLNNGEQTFAVAPPFEVGQTEKAPFNAVVFALEKCLPCPGIDVPVVDLLEFKKKHAASLARLRHELTKMHGALSGFKPDEQLEVFTRDLSNSVEDVTNAFQKSGFKWFKPDVEFSFRLPIFTTAAFLSSNPTTVMIAGIVGSIFSMKLSSSKLSKPGNMYPVNFQVLLSGFKEGLLEAGQSDAALANDIDLEIVYNSVPMSYPTSIIKPRQHRSSIYKGNIVT